MICAHEPRQSQGGGLPPGPAAPPPGGYGGPSGGYGAAPPPAPPGGYGPPAPTGYGMAPGPFAPAALGTAGSVNAGLKKQAQNWLIGSAASVFFCSSCLGIAGAVFCYLSMQAVDHGNIADAELKLKWGKILTIVGALIGALLSAGSLFYLIRMLLQHSLP